jgi:hypothetical protein
MEEIGTVGYIIYVTFMNPTPSATFFPHFLSALSFSSYKKKK